MAFQLTHAEQKGKSTGRVMSQKKEGSEKPSERNGRAITILEPGSESPTM
jgi:hypothetical protein